MNFANYFLVMSLSADDTSNIEVSDLIGDMDFPSAATVMKANKLQRLNHNFSFIKLRVIYET